MPRWIVIFEDHAEEVSKPIRVSTGEAHLAYLAANQQFIKLAGGLSHDLGGWYTGGLWVVEAESRDIVAILAQRDPYFTSGLRKNYTVALWGKAPCYGEVRL